jgi:predicted RNase H-like HicB family nuclease
MDAVEILKKPYARLVTPDSDGSFFAEIVEFPGCFATGRSAGQALQNLEEVAVDWVTAAVEQGQEIPQPMDAISYSGKTLLRMTKGLHKRAALWAHREGVSLNQFIVTCVAEAVGERARQVIIYPQPQGFSTLNFQLAWSGSGTAMTPIQTQKPQLATSTTGQFLGVPVQHRPEEVHAGN